MGSPDWPRIERIAGWRQPTWLVVAVLVGSIVLGAISLGLAFTGHAGLFSAIGGPVAGGIFGRSIVTLVLRARGIENRALLQQPNS
jgi:hypothetical protein